MSQIKAVIFDMDGLMFDTEPIYYKANQKTADHLGMDFSFDIYAQFIGMGDVDYKKTMRKLYKDHEVLEEFFDKSNQVMEYLLLNEQVNLKPGLIELLDYLHKEQMPAVVASSTKRELVDQLLERLEVKDYFQGIVGGDEVERAKPDPAIFNKAFNKTELPDKSSVLILEDSKNGVLAANAAGIPVIMVPDLIEADKETKDKTQRVYSSLTQVMGHIEKMNH